MSDSLCKLLLLSQVALTGDHDALRLRGTCAVEGFCPVSDRCGTEADVLQETHDTHSVICGAVTVSDEELVAEIKRKVKLPEGSSRADFLNIGMEKVNKIVPILLKKRRADIYGIVAVLNGKTIEEIGKQSFLATASQIREIFKDRDLIDFFKSCVDAEKSE